MINRSWPKKDKSSLKKYDINKYCLKRFRIVWEEI